MAEPSAIASPGPARPWKAFCAQVSIAALAAQLIWGFNVTAMKYTISQLDPYLVGAARLMLAGLILMILLRRSEGNVGLARRHWPLMILVAVSMGFNTICWQLGLSRCTASNASLIVNIAPIFALLLAVALGQERLDGRRLAGMLIALAGVSLIIGTGPLGLSRETLTGYLLVISAACFWACYNVLASRLLVRYSALRVTCWSMLIASGTMWLLSPLGVRSWDVTQAGGLAWLGLAYAATMGAVIAHTLWSRTIQKLGASRTMIYTYLNPLLVVLFAAILFGDRLTLLQGCGAVLALGGVAFTNSRRARPAPAPATTQNA